MEKNNLSEMEQPVNRFRYYITGAALFIGTFPHMEGMAVHESAERVSFENGAVNAFGVIDYPQPLTPEQVHDYCLIPASQNANYLKTAEMALEQNYNQIDGLVNNQEPLRVNQGYTIIASETVGCEEVVLAHSSTAPDPFVTWERNIQYDEQTGREDFYWGKYFSTEARARENFHTRVEDKREMLSKCRPSILSQLKSDAPRKDLPAAPQPGHKKDAPER